jgi:hypothetical protein
MSAALAFSRQALLEAPGAGEGAELSAKLIEALIVIRTHSRTASNDSARNAIGGFERAKLVFEAASARLEVAQALVATRDHSPATMSFTLKTALEALGFFEPRRIWESIWRAHLIAAQAAQVRPDVDAHRAAAGSALTQLKLSWPAGIVDNYLRRPDIRLLTSGLKL